MEKYKLVGTRVRHEQVASLMIVVSSVIQRSLRQAGIMSPTLCAQWRWWWRWRDVRTVKPGHISAAHHSPLPPP